MNLYDDAPRFLWAGDSAVVIQFGSDISPLLASRVHRTTRALETGNLPWLVEVLPSYRSVLAEFDPRLISPTAALDALRGIVKAIDAPDCLGVDEANIENNVVTIPVCYGGQFGPDLDDVAAHTGLSPGEVIALHSEPLYLVYMIGFTLGFPYLGGMSPRIATPRLATPRTVVPAGSVGIAGNQTGVYPSASPGGWRLIGRTPLRLADPSADPPCLLRAGNRIRFVPVDEPTYYSMGGDR
ncbi:MAG: 5-oxoprolinase subunit PxpB [Bacillota bacterium]